MLPGAFIIMRGPYLCTENGSESCTRWILRPFTDRYMGLARLLPDPRMGGKPLIPHKNAWGRYMIPSNLGSATHYSFAEAWLGLPAPRSII